MQPDVRMNLKGVKKNFEGLHRRALNSGSTETTHKFLSVLLAYIRSFSGTEVRRAIIISRIIVSRGCKNIAFTYNGRVI